MTRLLLTSIIAASVLAAGFALAPPSSNVVAAAEERGVCRIIEIALDEGYSVSRKALREVCDQP